MAGVETMLIFGTDAAMLKFVDGKSVKVGQDFTVVAVSDLGLGNNDSIFNKGDAVALSNCNGVTIDWSLTGIPSIVMDQVLSSRSQDAFPKQGDPMPYQSCPATTAILANPLHPQKASLRSDATLLLQMADFVKH